MVCNLNDPSYTFGDPSPPVMSDKFAMTLYEGGYVTLNICYLRVTRVELIDVIRSSVGKPETKVQGTFSSVGDEGIA